MKKLTIEEMEILTKLEPNVDIYWDDLSPFEKRFTEDLFEKLKLYGNRTQLSTNQWKIINEINEKVM